MTETRILLLGGGNMGRALVGGMLKHGWPAHAIAVSDPDPRAHHTMANKFGVRRLYHDNTVAYSETLPEVLIFAVKPDGMPTTATDLAPWMVDEQPLLISLAAGVRAEALARWVGGHCPVVRVMPNTPALVGVGMSVLHAREGVNSEQRELATQILGSVGETLWLEDERLMDAVTAVSGSGPAYFFAFLQALEESACALGLSAQQAHTLVLQTARGAVELASISGDSVGELREQVTSKGGTTEAALDVLTAGNFATLVAKALAAAEKRAVELGDESARA